MFTVWALCMAKPLESFGMLSLGGSQLQLQLCSEVAGLCQLVRYGELAESGGFESLKVVIQPLASLREFSLQRFDLGQCIRLRVSAKGAVEPRGLCVHGVNESISSPT